MLPRTLEPEVMDTLEEAEAYDAMDHAEVNTAFARRAVELTQAAALAGAIRVLDLGCGTAQIPILLAGMLPSARIDAVDLAEAMLVVGERRVRAAGLAERVTLRREDCKRLSLASGSYDAVVSNSLLHHLPEPILALREAARVLRAGGALLFRDLCRPASASEVDALVERYATGADAVQRELFRASLHAALTEEETREAVRAAGLQGATVSRTSDRHVTIERAGA
jgi:ubiquinone/menaquinone biosynthesis C-methylase UbiE